MAKTTITQLTKGSILLAEPSLLVNSSFQRSVILVSQYSKNGVVGFITNKPLLHTISDILPNVTEEYRIYEGGPVEKDNLYFVHSIPHLVPNSVQIDENLYWGGDFDAVSELILNDMIQPSDIKFFLGYSGWDYNQLNNEVGNKNWIVQNMNNSKKLLTDTMDSYWKESLNKLGGRYKIWANAPENPSYN